MLPISFHVEGTRDSQETAAQTRTPTSSNRTHVASQTSSGSASPFIHPTYLHTRL